MKIAIIGRSEALYDTVEYLHAAGFNIACILTAKEAQNIDGRQMILKHLLIR